MEGIIPDDRLITWEFYQNRPISRPPSSTADYLIFTSPSNATAWLEVHTPLPYQTLVAIGKTTDKALAARGLEKRIRAGHPTEEAIWDAIWKHRTRWQGH